MNRKIENNNMIIKPTALKFLVLNTVLRMLVIQCLFFLAFLYINGGKAEQVLTDDLLFILSVSIGAALLDTARVLIFDWYTLELNREHLTIKVSSRFSHFDSLYTIKKPTFLGRYNPFDTYVTLNPVSGRKRCIRLNKYCLSKADMGVIKACFYAN